MVCNSVSSVGDDHRVVGVLVRINPDDDFWLTREGAGGHDGGVSIHFVVLDDQTGPGGHNSDGAL